MKLAPNMLSRLALATLMATATLSCSDTGSTIFIRQMQEPDAEDSCLVRPDVDSTIRAVGLLDTAFPQNAYSGVMLVGNQMIPRGNADQLKPETSRVQFFEVEVELLNAQGSTIRAPFTQTVSGFADPASSGSPGFGLVIATLIPPGAADGQAGQTLVARTIVRGMSLGGEDVETGFWDFPILICDGCLLNGCIQPQACDDELAGTCGLGQDSPSDCRYVASTNNCP